MAARTDLVLMDRATTPVAHTFTPDGDDINGVHLFSEKTPFRAGDPRFSSRLRYTKGKYRPHLKMAVPIVATQTLNGVASPVIVRMNYVDCQFTFDGLSTPQERADVVGMFYSSLAPGQAMINDLVVNLTDSY